MHQYNCTGVILKLDENIDCGGMQQVLWWKFRTELEHKRKYIQDLKDWKKDLFSLAQHPPIDYGDKIYLLRVLEICDEAFLLFPRSLKSDEKFVMKCLQVNGLVIRYVTHLFRENIDFLGGVLQIEKVIKVLDRKFVLSLDYEPLQYLMWNREFFMRAVSINPKIFECACRYLKNDDELMFEALKYNRQHLNFATYGQLNRKLIFRACETKQSYPSKHLSFSVLTMCLPVAKRNPELALQILERDPESATCAVMHFKNHKHIIMKAIEIAPHLIFKVMKKQAWFPNMKEICLKALKTDSSIFKHLGKFRFDRDIFIAGYYYMDKNYPVTAEMLQDKECAKCLIKIDPIYMDQIAEHLRMDSDIIVLLASQRYRMSQEQIDKYLPTNATN